MNINYLQLSAKSLKSTLRESLLDIYGKNKKNKTPHNWLTEKLNKSSNQFHLQFTRMWSVLTVLLCPILIHFVAFNWRLWYIQYRDLTLYTLHSWASIFNGLIWYTTMSALFFFCQLLLSFTVVLPTSLHILGKCPFSDTSRTQSPFLFGSHSLILSCEWHAWFTTQPKVTTLNLFGYCRERMIESNITTSY